MPNLRRLNLDLKKDSEVQLILSSFPSLESLNDQDVDHESEENKEEESNEMNKDTPYQYHEICNAVKQYSKSQNLDKEFDILQNKWKNEASSNNNLKLQYELLDTPLEKLIDSLEETEAMKTLWKRVMKEQKAIVDELVSSKIPEEKKGNHIRNENDNENSNQGLDRDQFLAEKQELSQKISSLEEENKKLLDEIIKQSKSIGSVATPQKRIGEKQQSLFIAKNSPQSQKKALTLNQLKDLICDIYEQKQIYDNKCISTKLPKETMEQYLYTYLNQRYGLKNIIIEWASNIINAIKFYSAEDSDVALFGKIMRNECDEGFRFVYNEVKNAISDILRDILRRKYKQKTDKEIDKLRNDIRNGEIEQYQWSEIIEKMYNEEHYDIIVQRIKDRSEQFPASPGKNQNKKLTREEKLVLQATINYKLPFSEFQNIVLEFQMSTHEKYIRKFIQAFHKVDSENKGVLNEEKFKELLSKLGID